jgi:hypothetical protein
MHGVFVWTGSGACGVGERLGNGCARQLSQEANMADRDIRDFELQVVLLGTSVSTVVQRKNYETIATR